MDERDDGMGITYGKPLPATFQVKSLRSDESREVSGYILLNKGGYHASKAVLMSNKPFRVLKASEVYEGTDVMGICRAKKMSLVYCLGTLSSGGVRPVRDSARYVPEGKVTFMYAAFGEHHLRRDDRVIRGIRFTFDHADAMLSNRGYDAFGLLLRPQREVLDAIQQQVESDELCRGLPHDFNYKYAQVRYFTGKHTLFPDTDTVLGTIGASRGVSLWGWKHSAQEDYPFITIDFADDPVTLDEAFDKMRLVRQFFTWMTGFAPRWSDVHVSISAEDVQDTFVHSPVEWDEAQDDENPARKRTMLIDPSREPDKLSEVLATWLERNACPKRGIANANFFASMPGMFSRTVDQVLCKVADAFDILPPEDKPKFPSIPERIRNILSVARANIKSIAGLKSDPARDYVLSQLGYLHKRVKLKDTVQHRADIILDHLDDNTMPHLKELGAMAVACRNYFTHNSDPPDGVDFTNYHTVGLLARTLQFIYGASELVNCGWDMNAWLSSSLAQEHAFGSYVKRDYAMTVQQVLRPTTPE